MSWIREPDSEPLPGYRLIEPLGQGGFGEVWKCVAPGGIHKAIKFVFGNLNTVDSDSAKAEQEFKAIERVKAVRHPFVLSMDQIQILKGELVIVMELADKSLFDLLEEYQKAGRPGIPRDILLGFMADAAEGLDHLIEKHSLQHLDVKPKNLFLISDRVKVADFGLVSAVERSSSAGAMAGITPVYTSPETFQNKISKQSDQYSLAIVYAELLSGQRPFNGKNVRQLALQHMTQPPDLSALPEADRPAVARALSKNPDERFPTCLAFVRALIQNTQPDASLSNSLYNTSTGLRHAVASQGELNLPELPRPSSVTTVPAPAQIPVPVPAPSPWAAASVPAFPAVPPTPKSSPIPVSPHRASPSSAGVPSLVNPLAAANARSAPAPSSRPPLGVDPMSRPIPGRPQPSGIRRADSIATTTASRPPQGVLRPTLLVGVGSFGRKALEQIRARLLDRLGNLELVPSIRFLCLDAEPDGTAHKSLGGTPDLDLGGDFVLNLPLQPTTNYRRRHLEQLLEWLPREKFYAIPRNLAVDGNRSFGRLAFCDHALRAFTRLKNELHTATLPESIAASSEATGLTVLTRTPAVHVFASASGGTGGMLIDLGYCVRRALDKADAQRGPLTAFVFTGSPQDVNTPAAEQSNVMATLVELNHYAEPAVSFTAQYGGPDGVKVEESGPPFTATYLVGMPERSKAAFDDCLANLAGYVTHDVTTPLGATLERARRTGPAPGRTPFRQFGTFGLWYPRGLVVRSAARILCSELVRGWTNPSPSRFPPDVERLLDKLLGDPRLAPASVREAIDREATRRKSEHGSPVSIVTDWVRTTAAEADAPAAMSGGWAKAVMAQATEYVGLEPSDAQSSKLSRGKLSVALDRGITKLTEQWGNELTDAVRPLTEIPGVGLGACEYAIKQLTAACRATMTDLEGKLRDFAARRGPLTQAVQAAAAGSEAVGSSLSLFAGRTSRSRRSFGERFKQFMELRIEEDLTAASVRFYQALSDRLAATHHDLSVCRQQLSDLFRELAAPFTSAEDTAGGKQPSGMTADDAVLQTTLQMTNTIRVVLPNGEERIDAAADELLDRLSADDRARLEWDLHRNVFGPRGGLLGVCKTVTNLSRHLAPALLDQTATLIERQLPAEDVTAIEAAAVRGRNDGTARRVDGYVRAAAAHVTGPPADAKLFVTVPDSPTGRQFGEAVRAGSPNAIPIVIPNYRSDLLFCREQDWLRQTDLRDLVSTCWDAYAESCETVEGSPHIRFDVPQWLPLIAEPATRW